MYEFSISPSITGYTIFSPTPYFISNSDANAKSTISANFILKLNFINFKSFKNSFPNETRKRRNERGGKLR